MEKMDSQTCDKLDSPSLAALPAASAATNARACGQLRQTKPFTDVKGKGWHFGKEGFDVLPRLSRRSLPLSSLELQPGDD